MYDSVQLILRLSYYYSRLLGVINFEIDTKTGRARKTRRATIYAALANVLAFSLLPFLYSSELMHSMWSSAGLLHEYLFLLVLGMQVFCVILTLLNRWFQRHHLISVINAFCRLTRNKPQVMQMWRRGVISKFVSVVLLQPLQIIINFLTLESVTLNMILSTLLLYSLTVLVNVFISHFYFAMLNVHHQYDLLNQELRAVLADTRSLESEPRKAALMNKCCSLADRVEDIAKTQTELQTLVKRLAQIFGIQSLCVSSNFYITSIASVYWTFAALMETSSLGMIIFLLTITLGIYFGDAIITFNNTFSVLDDHTEMLKLLEQYSTFAPGLDVRLEAVFESFQLQLSSNPLQISILNLYNMERTNAIYFASSVISNSMVLIQYEMKYKK